MPCFQMPDWSALYSVLQDYASAAIRTGTDALAPGLAKVPADPVVSVAVEPAAAAAGAAAPVVVGAAAAATEEFSAAGVYATLQTASRSAFDWTKAATPTYVLLAIAVLGAIIFVSVSHAVVMEILESLSKLFKRVAAVTRSIVGMAFTSLVMFVAWHALEATGLGEKVETAVRWGFAGAK